MIFVEIAQWHDIYCIVLDQLWLLRQFGTLLRKGSQMIFLTFSLLDKSRRNVAVILVLTCWWKGGTGGAKVTAKWGSGPAQPWPLSTIAAHWYKYRGVGTQGQIILYRQSSLKPFSSSLTRPVTSQISVRYSFTVLSMLICILQSFVSVSFLSPADPTPVIKLIKMIGTQTYWITASLQKRRMP